jgi:hypothetical protein
MTTVEAATVCFKIIRMLPVTSDVVYYVVNAAHFL